MATKEREKIYECEVKRRRLAEGKSGYETFWKTKSVQEALDDNDSEFRCKDCHGAVKLFRRRVAGSPGSHVEHTNRPDAEYCSGGMLFRQATDGREPRLSEAPVG